MSKLFGSVRIGGVRGAKFGVMSSSIRCVRALVWRRQRSETVSEIIGDSLRDNPCPRALNVCCGWSGYRSFYIRMISTGHHSRT